MRAGIPTWSGKKREILTRCSHNTRAIKSITHIHKLYVNSHNHLRTFGCNSTLFELLLIFIPFKCPGRAANVAISHRFFGRVFVPPIIIKWHCATSRYRLNNNNQSHLHSFQLCNCYSRYPLMGFVTTGHFDKTSPYESGSIPFRAVKATERCKSTA